MTAIVDILGREILASPAPEYPPAAKQQGWLGTVSVYFTVRPDGSINNGCYLKNRADISCAKCGFAAHVEMSLAYDWHWEAIQAGSRIFGF